MNLMSSTKQCISAVELSRRLGASDPTAWYLYKRLRHAMTEEADRCRLGAPAEGGWTPIVEADDAYLGVERNEGRGTAGKTHVIAACERHSSGRMGAVAMAVFSGFSNEEATAFRDAHIAAGAHVYTEGTPAPTSSAKADALTSPPSPAVSGRHGSATPRSSPSTP
jgi:hypothetical protein